MYHIPAWEERLAKQDFGKDAADRPDVDGCRILCKEGPTELWSPVPSMASVDVNCCNPPLTGLGIPVATIKNRSVLGMQAKLT